MRSKRSVGCHPLEPKRARALVIRTAIGRQDIAVEFAWEHHQIGVRTMIGSGIGFGESPVMRELVRRFVVTISAAPVCSLAFAGSASGALRSGCSAVGHTVTCTFVSTGREQIFTVPSGVSALYVVASGGRGGDAGLELGGLGATATGDVHVTAGQVLYVEVGGNGGARTSPSGGFNGGAAGGVSTAFEGSQSGAGGGGASDVRTVSDSATGSLGSRLVI